MKVYQEKTVHRKSGKAFGISLRLQLIVGFAVPIILLIAVGMISYYAASSGMVENYENSAINALDMTMECLERGVAPCVANALELANNTMVSSYVQGGYDSDSSRQSTVRQTVTKDILVKQTTNDFIGESRGKRERFQRGRGGNTAPCREFRENCRGDTESGRRG